MKRILLILSVFSLLVLSACGSSTGEVVKDTREETQDLQKEPIDQPNPESKEVVKYVCPDGKTTVENVNDCPKPKEEPKQNTNSGSDFVDSLNELKNTLEDTTRINKKIDECTKLCAGEDIDIPVMKVECQSACYQTHYYGGEGALDNLIEEYKNE